MLCVRALAAHQRFVARNRCHSKLRAQKVTTWIAEEWMISSRPGAGVGALEGTAAAALLLHRMCRRQSAAARVSQLCWCAACLWVKLCAPPRTSHGFTFKPTAAAGAPCAATEDDEPRERSNFCSAAAVWYAKLLDKGASREALKAAASTVVTVMLATAVAAAAAVREPRLISDANRSNQGLGPSLALLSLRCGAREPQLPATCIVCVLTAAEPQCCAVALATRVLCAPRAG